MFIPPNISTSLQRSFTLEFGYIDGEQAYGLYHLAEGNGEKSIARVLVTGPLARGPTSTLLHG